MPNMRLISLVAAAAIALAGCGYRPLYGDRNTVPGSAPAGSPGAASVRDRLAEVKILGIADRRGQLLRNYLLDRMNPGGEPAQARYTLAIVTTESTRITDSRADGTATRSDLVMSARFSLRDARTDTVVYIDSSDGVATFNLLTNRFSSVASEDEARRRAVELIADKITTQLALFMNRRHGETAAAPRKAE